MAKRHNAWAKMPQCGQEITVVQRIYDPRKPLHAGYEHTFTLTYENAKKHWGNALTFLLNGGALESPAFVTGSSYHHAAITCCIGAATKL